MALSIKNDKAERLARALAAESGETIAQAIIQALEERLERLKGRHTVPDTAEAIMEISRRCRMLPDRDDRSPEAILGYDEIGAAH